ncbi:MAG: Exodeoxyribonuclease [Symbiobacteriaceae bacterium]|jgi:ATP-dependent helicase/nuclease subunit A|nr:Exodeoxyribonuclease [Symbiobacteriaceae bacterium]
MSSYTPAQHRAIYSDANLVVTAGAGAGKTRVLTQRWIRLLLERHLDIDQVVAITFTEKAAAEMRERCRKELRALAATGNARAADLLERMDEARISTFHSFCQSLLGFYPVEAGLDPDFGVADDLEAGLLLAEAVDECLNEVSATADETVVDLLTRFGRTRLATHLERLIGQMRNLGETPASLRLATDAALERLGGDRQPLLDGVRAAVETLLATATKPGSKGKEQQEQLAATWAGLTLATVSVGDLRAMAGAINGVSLKPKQPLVDAIDALEALDATQQAAAVGLAVLGLVEQALARYQARKAELDLLDFSDLIDRLRRLLEESPAVRAELAREGLIFLNDEVQDTDPSQWAVIRQMLLPPGADELPPGRVFIVGDPKQSIYRFRGARVDIFAAMTAEVAPDDDHRVGLMKNFRSQAGLIDLVNSLFGQIMAAPGVGAVPYAAMEPHRAPQAQVAELLLSRSQGAEGRREEAAGLARRIRELVEGGVLIDGRPARYGDVAILVQAMTHVSTYASALAAAGVPYYVVAGDGFFQAQEVADIENLLRVLDDPADAIALAGWLRSPHVGLSDDALVAMGLHEGGFLAAWAGAPGVMGVAVPPADAPLLARARRLLPRLRALAWQEPLPRLLPALYAELDLHPVLLAQPDGQSAVANLGKLAAMVSDFAGKGRHQFPDLLRWLRTARELEAREGLAAMAEEGGNSVRIMTVHKSKGLEFPVVVLPDIGRSQKADSPEIILHPQVGLAPKLLDDDGTEITSGLRNLAVDLNKQESEQEFRRLFYVAATRARDYLMLSAIQPRSADGATWLHWLCAAAGAEVGAPPAELVIGPVAVPVRPVGEGAESGEVPTAEAEAAVASPAAWPGSPTGWPGAPGAPSPGVQRILAQAAPLAPGGARTELQTSASRLMLYQDCPRKYYLQTALGLPDLRRAPSGWDALATDSADLEGDIAAESVLEPTVRGTIVHAVCERLSNPADLEALIAQAVQENGVDLSHPDVETAVREPLRRYVASPFFARIRAAGGGISELDFNTQLEGMTLEGFIDKVIEEDDGLVVIDFKTNHVTTPEQIDEAAAHYRLQMQIYALAAQERLGRPVKDALLYFLTPGEARSCQADLDEAAVRSHLREMGEQLRSASTWVEFQPNTAHCARCQYREFCREEA